MSFWKKTKLILPLISLLGPCLFAQTGSKEIHIYFHDAESVIDTSYSNNAEVLASLDSLLSSINHNPSLDIVNVSLEGWASPSGHANFNKTVSRERGLVLKSMLMERYNIPEEKISLTHSYIGIDYELLSKLVKEDGYRYADEVVSIIEDAPAPGAADTRKSRLMSLRAGKVYKELAIVYFPLLRRTDVVVNYSAINEPDAEPAIEPAIEPAPEPQQEVQPTEAPMSASDNGPRHYFSIHTNMLLDVIAIPNIGAECYLGNNISIAGNWWYAWWKNDSVHKYWRSYGGYIAPRWWFGNAAHNKPLTGHHLGLYGEVFLYDFEWGATGYLSGVPGENIFHDPSWAAGLEYGFALPIAKRLNIDFSIGMGYLRGIYRKYDPIDDCYVWQSTNMRNWFGPTRAEVSLVWLLGRGNVNEQKGGRK